MGEGHKGPDYRTTTDIAIAAYMMVRGLHVKKAERRNGGGGRTRFSFTFHDPEGKFDEYANDFPNSESQVFDSKMRVLKKMAYQQNGGK